MGSSPASACGWPRTWAIDIIQKRLWKSGSATENNCWPSWAPALLACAGTAVCVRGQGRSETRRWCRRSPSSGGQAAPLMPTGLEAESRPLSWLCPLCWQNLPKIGGRCLSGAALSTTVTVWRLGCQPMVPPAPSAPRHTDQPGCGAGRRAGESRFKQGSTHAFSRHQAPWPPPSGKEVPFTPTCASVVGDVVLRPALTVW